MSVPAVSAAPTVGAAPIDFFTRLLLLPEGVLLAIAEHGPGLETLELRGEYCPFPSTLLRRVVGLCAVSARADYLAVRLPGLRLRDRAMSCTGDDDADDFMTALRIRRRAGYRTKPLVRGGEGRRKGGGFFRPKGDRYEKEKKRD